MPALADALRAGAGSVWLVRAGAWPLGPYEPPPPSATGRPLLAFGAVLGDSPEARTWRAPRDLEREPLPAALSVWVEAPLAANLGGLITPGLANGLLRLRDSRRPRVVRAAAIDVAHDARLRAAEIVTSLQQGGAERVALDLARALPTEGVATLLAVLGAPTREAFARPRATAMLTWERRPTAARTDGLAAALFAAGVDVAHAHLLDADEIRLLSRTGLPVVVTLHNQRPGWPSGTESLRPGDARLVVACSRAVEADVRAAGIGISASRCGTASTLAASPLPRRPTVSSGGRGSASAPATS